MVQIVFLKKFNITVKFVHSNDPADFAAVIDDRTRAIYVESIGNPGYIVPDLRAFADVRASPIAKCGVDRNTTYRPEEGAHELMSRRDRLLTSTKCP